MRAEELLSDVKNDMDITCSDELIDGKLLDAIARGQSYLDNVAGTELSYEEGTVSRSLLYAYVRYDTNKCMELFQQNYLPELNALRIGVQVDEFAKQQGYV